jgi:hypothetical protein
MDTEHRDKLRFAEVCMHTTDQLLIVLRHVIIDKQYYLHKKPLFCFFVDWQNALNCDLKYMAVNVQDTQISSCKSRDAVGFSWQFAGEAIEVSIETDRLQVSGSCETYDECCNSAATMAMWSVMCQAQAKDIQQISIY